jgi:hypothetical protein
LVASIEIWCADLPLRQRGKCASLKLAINVAPPAVGIWPWCR